MNPILNLYWKRLFQGTQEVTNGRGYRWKRINLLWNKGEDFFCFSCIFQKKVVPLRAD